MDTTDRRPRAEHPFRDAYALEREIGRGGMASVYLARDRKHDRPVAIKVLHADLAAVLGAERFLHEIRVTAHLQHPHVLGLIDSGVFPAADGPGAREGGAGGPGGLATALAGRPYYVMPYVAGQSLRRRLEREGPLPVADALRIAGEVAGALDHAHRRGVVHRDVKPENILLGEDGQALVADFGIALAVEHAGAERLTQTGLSLGTPHYMSPEQATGERAIDARADVYALGAVLYELLAGEPPFTGPTAQAVVARVLTESPRSLTAQRPSVPPHVDAAVRTALEKLPADRFPTAAAFAAALAAPAAAAAAARRRAPDGRRGPRLPRTALVAAGALAGAAVGWAATRAGARAAADPGGARAPVRFVIEPDSGELQPTAPAISPDGRAVAYAADSPDGPRLFVRRLAELQAHPVAGTEQAERPFFSPDGQWLGFYAGGALRKVRVEGGPVAVIAPLPAPTTVYSAEWTSDGAVVYTTNGGALFRVPAAGGAAVRVPVRAGRVFSAAHVPGRAAYLVTHVVDSATVHVGVLDPASGRVTTVGPGFLPRYADGHVVYAGLDNQLYRRPFDADRLRATGPAEAIARDIRVEDGPSFDVSRTGALIYRVGTPLTMSNGRLAITDRLGREERVLAVRAPWVPRFSRDGSRLAYGASAPGRDLSDVWVTDLDAGTTQRITTDARDNNDPQWSPDGQALAYSALAGRSGKDVVVQALDGTTRAPAPLDESDDWPSDWTPDGSAVLFTRSGEGGSQDIWVRPAAGGPPRPYLATPAREAGARVSPDGRWVAYTSNETGRDEVYVQSFPVPGRKTLVSPSGGMHPVWRGDGRELFYWQGDLLVAVGLAPAGPRAPLALRARSPLFRAAYLHGAHPNYDASPDGRRFVVVTGRARSNGIVVTVGALGGGRAVR